MADLSCVTDLREKLAAAEAAYHDLMTGAKVQVYVDADGSRVQYNSQNAASLYAYIQGLRARLASPDPCGVNFGAPSFPASVRF